MRIVYFLILILSSMYSNAQFIGAGHGKTETALLLFEDGTIKEGVIKNDPINYITNVEGSDDDRNYNKIKYYSKDGEKHKVYRKDVSQVQLKTKDGEYYTYKKLIFRKLSSNNRRVFDQEKFMYVVDNGLKGFRRYTYLIRIYKPRPVESYYYLIQHPVTKEYYHLEGNDLIGRKEIINLMELLGSECPDFLEYLDEINNMKDFYTVIKSVEKFMEGYEDFPEFIEIVDDQDKVVSNLLNVRTRHSLEVEYLIAYFYKKYLSFGCTPEDAVN